MKTLSAIVTLLDLLSLLYFPCLSPGRHPLRQVGKLSRTQITHDCGQVCPSLGGGLVLNHFPVICWFGTRAPVLLTGAMSLSWYTLAAPLFLPESNPLCPVTPHSGLHVMSRTLIRLSLCSENSPKPLACWSTSSHSMWSVCVPLWPCEGLMHVTDLNWDKELPGPWTGNPGRLTFCRLQLGPPCPEGGSHIYSRTVFPAPSLCRRCDGCWQHKRDRMAVSPCSLRGFGPAHRSGVGAWAPTRTLSSHCFDDYENMTRIVFYEQQHLFWEFQQNDRSSPLFVLRLFALSRLDNPEDSYWFSHCISPLKPSWNSCVQMDASPPGLSQHLFDTPEEHFLTWMVTVCGVFASWASSGLIGWTMALLSSAMLVSPMAPDRKIESKEN